MTSQIKIITVFLVVFAVASIFSFFDIFTGARSASFFESSKPLPPIKNDADGDGLTDSEESYWNTDFLNSDTDGDGYLDGEEVASGHDPRIPSSKGDLFKNVNLTQKVSELAVAGIYENSLKPDSPNFESSLVNLADYTIGSIDLSLLGDLSPSIVKKVESTHETQDKYMTQVYETIKSFMTLYGQEFKTISFYLELINAYGYKDETTVNYFSEKERQFREIFNKATAVEVPENWINEHYDLLSELKIAAESNHFVSTGGNDPLKASLSLYQFFGILERVPDWSWHFIEKNRSENINNSLIESLDK